jgi:hypothetical protein
VNPTANQVIFFEKEEYNGTSRIYNIGDNVSLVDGDTFLKKYKSIKVGSNCIVQFDADKSVVYTKFVGGKYEDYPAFHDSTKFSVERNTAMVVVSIKLVDQTGQTRPGAFLLDFEAYESVGLDVKNIEVKSDIDATPDSSDSNLLAMIRNYDVACAFYVRNAESGLYWASGLLYLWCKDLSKEIEIKTFGETFPKNMSVERDGTNLTLILKSPPARPMPPANLHEAKP